MEIQEDYWSVLKLAASKLSPIEAISKASSGANTQGSDIAFNITPRADQGP